MESRSIDDYQQPKSQFPDKEIRQTRWWSQKGPYVLAIGCICGLGTGIAHHFYYASLDGKRVENQAVSRILESFMSKSLNRNLSG